MSLSKSITKKSKYLSLLLRHDPAQAGLVFDEAGWTDVSKLLHAVGWKMDELEEIVSTDEKKRYEFDQFKTKIRASQGHSIDVNLGYEIKEPPEFLYHGTSYNNYDSIKNAGLLKMDRHDVHMFADKELALDIATKRRKKPIVLTIRARAMSEAGFKFKLSANGVWLTETIPPSFLILEEFAGQALKWFKSE